MSEHNRTLVLKWSAVTDLARFSLIYSLYDKDKVDLEQVVLDDVWTLLQ